MVQRFVTGIDTNGEYLENGDFLTVLPGAAITLAPEWGTIGILSGTGTVSATVFGSVVASGVGIRLSGDKSSVFIGQSGTVTGGLLGVSLGSQNAREVSFRNEGTITGQRGGVLLQGNQLDFVNTGTISASATDNEIPIVAVAFQPTSNLSTYLTNSGEIIAGRQGDAHNAVFGSANADIIHNTGLIRGNISLGAGDDRYYGQEGFWEGSSISLGRGKNTAFGGRGAEIFVLDQEKDRLDDFVDGGAGSDGLSLVDGAEDVTVDLRRTDWQNTGVGGLTLRNVENLSTGDGDDRVIGNADDNLIITNWGKDTLEGGFGDDSLVGGEGDDTALYSGSTAATVDLRKEGLAQDTGYGIDILSSIENLTGGAGDDVFIGDNGGNLLSGSGGNDTLQGGLGQDTLDGGAGADTAVFSGNRAAYRITGLGSGSVTVEGADGTDLVRNVRFLKFDNEVVAATNAAPTGLVASAASVVENAPLGSVVATLSAQDADGDALTYSLGAGSPFAIEGNSLVVGSALDFEAGRQHNVVVQARDDYGGVTSQTFTIAVTNAVETTPFVLQGGAGADALQGEAGDDTVYGGAGSDVLNGGAGQDKFVFNTRTGRANVDAIGDFVVRDDSIWLDNAVFKALGGRGSLSNPQKLGSDAFIAGARAQDREDRIVYDKKSGKLYYDQDGTGSKAQVQIATLTKGLKMTAADFFVI